MLFTLIVIIAILIILGWWYSSNRRREIAYQFAKQYCEERDVQLLDQSVHCYKLGLTRQEGRVAIKAIYRFDYTAHGIERQQCHLIVVGKQLLWASALNTDESSEITPPDSGKKVLDFSQYKDLKSQNDPNGKPKE